MHVIQAERQQQADGNLGGSHCQDENEHNLAVRLPPSRAGDNERQPRGIEHDFNGHQYEYQIASYHQSDEPQREQDPCQQHPLIHRC